MRKSKIFWGLMACSIGMNIISLILFWKGAWGGGHAPKWLFSPYMIINYPLVKIFYKERWWLPDGGGVFIIAGLTTLLHAGIIGSVFAFLNRKKVSRPIDSRQGR